MTHNTSLNRIAAALTISASALAPTIAAAQSSPSAGPDSSGWKFGATIYGYLPTIGGSSSFPVDSTGNPVHISTSQILDSLKMTFMGSFDAHNGQWGVFTDLLYLDLGGSKSQTHEFSIAGVPIGSTTADLNLDFKGTIWTLAGEYRLASDPNGLTIDALAGTRLFNMRQTLGWTFYGNIGPIDPAARIGTASASQNLWDGIVGVKGRVGLGTSGEWSVPFYLDVGAGNSQLTYQAAGGISYGFKWGELTAMWRYLSYDMKSGQVIQSMNFNGPMIGATFRW
jgi:hypothetical protein